MVKNSWGVQIKNSNYLIINLSVFLQATMTHNHPAPAKIAKNSTAPNLFGRCWLRLWWISSKVYVRRGRDTYPWRKKKEVAAPAIKKKRRPRNKEVVPTFLQQPTCIRHQPEKRRASCCFVRARVEKVCENFSFSKEHCWTFINSVKNALKKKKEERKNSLQRVAHKTRRSIGSNRSIYSIGTLFCRLTIGSSSVVELLVQIEDADLVASDLDKQLVAGAVLLVCLVCYVIVVIYVFYFERECPECV